MKTKDLEVALGLSKHTIRYYEKEGFIHPKRDENGYRDYGDEDLQILALVKFLRNLNISIDDVKGIMAGQVNFQECLEVNKIHLEKQIESIKDVMHTVQIYKDKDLPLIPALAEIEIQEPKEGLGFHKTTSTVSLGRKLTRSWAIRKIFYTLPVGIFGAIIVMFMFSFASIELPMFLKIGIGFFVDILIQMILIASSFQTSSIYFGDIIDHSMNQSVEFIDRGIRYYQFKGFRSNLAYFFAVLLKKDHQFMHFYPYEDIDQVTIIAKKRYTAIKNPVAFQLYGVDFVFEFHDGKRFYFYWPMTLDDDMRFIAYILEEKIKSIKDNQNILYAMKNGINLNDYLISQ